MANERQENKKNEKQKKRRWNYKKISIALAILVVILIIVILILFRTQIAELFTSPKETTFIYNGMTFNKTYFGKLLMYETNLAIYRPVQDNIIYWTLKLRNDPRELDKNIAANITNKTTRKVYISFDRYPIECNGTMLAAYKLGEFFDVLGVYKEAAFATEDLAKENNNTYKVKNCSDAQGKWSVVLLKQSDTNKSYIHQEGQCYILKIANCETIETTERFFLALIDTMKEAPSESVELQNNETNTANESI